MARPLTADEQNLADAEKFKSFPGFPASDKTPGISIDETGHIIAKFIAPDGSRQSVDLTAEIERIATEKAEAAVMDHMKKWHGHQI